MSDTIIYTDEGTWDLANRVRDGAVAHDHVYLGGSIYHVTVTDGATASEDVFARKPATVTDSAVATEQVAFSHNLLPSEAAAAGDTVLATKRATITITDGALASESATPFIAVTVTEAAALTDAIALLRPVTVTDAAAAGETVSGLRTHVEVVTDGAAADDANLRAPLLLGIAESAVAVESVTPLTRASNTVSEAAAATETVATKTTMIVIDRAIATEAISAAGIFTVTVADAAEASDYTRLPAASMPNLYVNAHTAALAQWDSLELDSIIEYGGVLYGAGPAGLYTLTNGQDDDSGVTPIEWGVTWDLSDFGTPQKKRIGAVYVAAASAGPFTVRLAAEQGRVDVQTRLPRNSKATNHRALTPRGLEAVYFRVGIRSSKDFGADHVVVEYESVARRLT